MPVTFSSIFCCCLSLSVVSLAFIDVSNFRTDCSLDEIRQHCHDRAVECKRQDSSAFLHRRYFCTCKPGFHGQSCDQVSSLTSTLAPTVATQAVRTTRTPLTTPTSTMPSTTTETESQVNQYCNKYSVVADLSHGQPVSNGFAPKCPSGSFASTEAFVLNNCNVSAPDMWHQGKQVMSECNSIPTYTAVGTYLNGLYPVGTGLSGVFLECLPNGFKIALQLHCDQTPEVRSVEQGGLGFLDPNFYYTIA